MEDMEKRRLEALKLGPNAFTDYNSIQLESAERDLVVYRLDIRPESRNPYGMVHGGALYTMADDAAGTAAHSDGRHYVTQHGDLHFLDNRAHGVIRAAGRVRHRGRSTVLVDVEITDEAGGVLATGVFTYFCVDRKRMAERAQET
ncbi:PaaI family thioesterase [uncultured Oscillibacter sp.]|jgi:acyl-CoA thioesterase|uniref:PaaI family thioesterase n=1 Tax=uncultured Oscillibacter sp. TaxID=876091 RepID=UPI0025EB698F|nr:PaaI family thioesterase [uncultured Oscillibacter sp.]